MYKLFITEFEKGEKVHRADITFAYKKADWNEEESIVVFKDLADAFEAYCDEVELEKKWVSRKCDLLSACVELVEMTAKGVDNQWGQELLYQHIICKRKAGY